MTDNRMSADLMRAFIKTLEPGDKIVVDARDKTRTLEVTQPARYVTDAYQTTGYRLPLSGYGTSYTVCVPDNEDGFVRLRYPSNPGLGERVRQLTHNSNRTTSSTKTDSTTATDSSGVPQIVTDTTAADIIDSDPEDDFR